MELHPLDIAIIISYLVGVVLLGFVLSKRAARGISSYFLGSRNLPWYILGVSNASGMFDITGTMWLVSILFVYGLKSVWIPWMWPTFNQVFLMIFLAIWLRRSGVITGAEWIKTRFGSRLGGQLSHISVVIFALVMAVGMLAYAFKGIGKFADIYLPGNYPPEVYALAFMSITTVYVILGGMYSVVLTDLVQFIILTIASVFIGIIAMTKTSAPEIAAAVPQGWTDISFGWVLNLDWSGLIASINDKIASEDYSIFGLFFMMILFKGILVSMAGPAPNYDMQRVLATKNPKEAGLMSWFVSIALFFPRYLMITGIVVLGLVFYSDNLAGMGTGADFEQVLPLVIREFVPVGVTGILIAGLLAAFMSTFDSTVNAGAAYIVNDIYKRYINPDASDKRYVVLSYISSIALVAIGIIFGWKVKNINEIATWITGALLGGYIAPNFLKWYWWRFNGFGYFGGMIAGVITAMAIPSFSDLSALQGFPIILAVAAVASVVTSLVTAPEEDEVLKSFYRRVRPWGFWKPIHDKVVAEDPSFRKNTNFKRDMVNVAVGIIWQLMLTLIPIYLVIKHFKGLWISVAIFVVTSIFLKKNWYDKLEDEDEEAVSVGNGGDAAVDSVSAGS